MSIIQRAFRLGLSFLIVACLTAGPAVFAQDASCNALLAEAEQQYTFGRFDEAIGLLDTCMDRADIREEEKQQAYRLMGLSYLGQKLKDDARETLRKLIELVPNYQIDPVQDPPPFVQLIEELRREMNVDTADPSEARSVVQRQLANDPPQETSPPLVVESPKKKRLGKWLVIGGGLVAGGITTVLLLSGGDDTTPPPALPPVSIADPPSLPVGN